MELQLSAANISWADGKDFSKSGMQFGFKAVPLGFDNIKLKTGQTFGSPMHNRVYGKGDEPIGASLYIGLEIIEENGREWHSELNYIDRLIFNVRLPESELKELQSLILAGNVPRTAFIIFDDTRKSGFSYGNLPDGRDMTWDNEVYKKISIQSVRFGNFTIPGYPDTALPEYAEVQEAQSGVIDAKLYDIKKELSFIKNALVFLAVLVGFISWKFR
jgi:hypothetical protein